jgi:hypothetical protein
MSMKHAGCLKLLKIDHLTAPENLTPRRSHQCWSSTVSLHSSTRRLTSRLGDGCSQPSHDGHKFRRSSHREMHSSFCHLQNCVLLNLIRRDSHLGNEEPRILDQFDSVDVGDVKARIYATQSQLEGSLQSQPALFLQPRSSATVPQSR